MAGEEETGIMTDATFQALLSGVNPEDSSLKPKEPLDLIPEIKNSRKQRGYPDDNMYILLLVSL